VETDTTVYSFDKIIELLCKCNPNTIEILGLKPEHYLYLSPIGEELVNNRKMFLSKQAIHSFGGYANAQLRRLENKSARLVSQSDNEKHILKTIEHASVDFKQNYFPMSDGELELFIDKAVEEGYDTEIFMNINLQHYPLRDWANMWNEMKAIVSGYGKIGKRNSKAIEHSKLGKHMCHLVRLYLMCFDILEYGEICTYREKEHDFLMDIRNGKYLDENRQPTQEFYKIVDDMEKKLDYLKEHTGLPDTVDREKIDDFVASVNERVITNEGYIS
jgi:predicted nucleotidyltransferase